ncbi:MAG: DUF6982 domain-containing protein [Bryobacteraceae bacterium]
MPASTTKKAIVERFERESLPGYVNPLSFQQPTGVELLTEQGLAMVIPYTEVRLVAFVRDFHPPAEPWRRVFRNRPKMEGLWVNLELRDGDRLEGVLPNNLLQIESQGFTIIPPDPFGHRQRLFVPRLALKKVEVLGVVGSSVQKRKAKPAATEQIGLFDEGRPDES